MEPLTRHIELERACEHVSMAIGHLAQSSTLAMDGAASMDARVKLREALLAAARANRALQADPRLASSESPYADADVPF